MIPHFTFENTVRPEEGRHDRIKVKMDLGIAIGTTRSLDLLRHALSASHDSADNHRPYLFCRPQGRGMLRPPLDLRQKPTLCNGQLLPPPLFSGQLAFSSYVGAGDRSTNLNLSLIINPTRLARYQHLPYDPQEDMVNLLDPETPDCHTAEFHLDGGDNSIPAGPQDESFSPDKWLPHVGACFEDARNLIWLELLAARIDAPQMVSRLPPSEGYDDFAAGALDGGGAIEFSEAHKGLLESVESYWEMTSLNPIGHVREMIALLADFSKSHKLTSYLPPSNIRAQIDGNCPSLSLEVLSGVYLKIYAKTSQRIRFEVTHEVADNPSILGRLTGDDGHQTRSRTFQNTQELLEFLRILRIKAAVIVNRALQHMRARRSVVHSHINETVLIAKLGRLVKDDSMAVAFAELLRTRGGISSENGPLKMRNALRTLARHDVLTFNTATNLYEPCPEYQHAVRRLRDRQDSLLEARCRVQMPSEDEEPRPLAVAPQGFATCFPHPDLLSN